MAAPGMAKQASVPNGKATSGSKQQPIARQESQPTSKQQPIARQENQPQATSGPDISPDRKPASRQASASAAGPTMAQVAQAKPKQVSQALPGTRPGYDAPSQANGAAAVLASANSIGSKPPGEVQSTRPPALSRATPNQGEASIESQVCYTAWSRIEQAGMAPAWSAFVLIWESFAKRRIVIRCPATRG
jgi:hypothetical protein